MRLIAISADDYGAPQVICTVDGVVADNVVFADEKFGYVREFYRNEDGTLAHDGETLLTRERRGVVRLSWPNNPEIELVWRGGNVNGLV